MRLGLKTSKTFKEKLHRRGTAEATSLMEDSQDPGRAVVFSRTSMARTAEPDGAGSQQASTQGYFFWKKNNLVLLCLLPRSVADKNCALHTAVSQSFPSFFRAFKALIVWPTVEQSRDQNIKRCHKVLHPIK